MTYGSANDADGVVQYLRSVHGGRQPAPELVAEFERRYRLIEQSPLVEITVAQGRALQSRLDEVFGSGRFLVAVGMLHSAPRIADAVDDLHRQGARQILAITLAPQFSSIILSGYQRTIDHLAASRQVEISLAGAWHIEPALIASLADRLQAALATLPGGLRGGVPIIFTAHSLPLAVVERDPDYIQQLTETAESVSVRAGLGRQRWQFAYQSAGHTPEPWLKPDLADLLPDLRAAGHRDVLIAPLQFVADHLEVLYDLDIAACEQAEKQGLRYHRMAMPNTSPGFIAALVEVVLREHRGQSSKVGIRTSP